MATERGTEALVLLNRERVPWAERNEAPWVMAGTPAGRPWRAERGVEVTWAPRYRVHECAGATGG